MQKRTRSILEELDAIYVERHEDRDRRYIIESQAADADTNEDTGKVTAEVQSNKLKQLLGQIKQS